MQQDGNIDIVYCFQHALSGRAMLLMQLQMEQRLDAYPTDCSPVRSAERACFPAHASFTMFLHLSLQSTLQAGRLVAQQRPGQQAGNSKHNQTTPSVRHLTPCPILYLCAPRVDATREDISLVDNRPLGAVHLHTLNQRCHFISSPSSKLPAL